jgi:YegS/Rv2252/BmrU family lipid kinase
LSSEQSFHKAWLIANPTAGGMGGQRRLQRAIQLLRDSGVPLAEIRWTRARGDAEEWARQAVGQGIDLVIGSGGDGTLNEIVNGLAKSETAMGILPAGTANVVACELRIPRHPVAGAKVILEGKRERIHLGHAQYKPIPNEPAPPGAGEWRERYFLFGAGLGFDAYICHHLSASLKRWTRKGTYLIYGLRHWLRYQAPEIRVSLDGGPEHVCSMAMFSNARAYAGDFWLAPHASLKKPFLDVNMFLGRGRLDLLRYVWGIFRGTHTTYPDVKYLSATRAEVRAERFAYLHLDGDTVGTSPARVRIEPDALTILAPQHWPPVGPPDPKQGLKCPDDPANKNASD